MKIGLLFGGDSYEHDISIITASVIYEKLKNDFELILLYISKDKKFISPKKILVKEFIKSNFKREFKFISGGVKIGCVNHELTAIISLMHGENGEDGLGSILANLYDIPFVGTNNISGGLLLDKYFTYAILRQNNINILESNFYYKKDKLQESDYPIIAKPARLGSSIGINVINSIDELYKVKNCFLYDEKIIIQKYLQSFTEYNQAAYKYNDEIFLSEIEEVKKSDEILSFTDKYSEAKVVKKHKFITDKKIIDEISEITKKVYKLFNLSGIIRIDYLLYEDIIYVNEVNTTPGSLSYYLFKENFTDIVRKLIKEALINKQKQNSKIYYSDVLTINYSYKK